jgi:hypothetical protein
MSRDFELEMTKEAALRGITVEDCIKQAFDRAYGAKAPAMGGFGPQMPQNSPFSSEKQPENDAEMTPENDFEEALSDG